MHLKCIYENGVQCIKAILVPVLCGDRKRGSEKQKPDKKWNNNI